MSEKLKRATLYLEEDLHMALKLKAAATEISMSEIVNDAVRIALSEDADDIADIRDRQKERTVSFDDFVTSLKSSGKL